MNGTASDPRMVGTLLVIHREGETSDPRLEAEALAVGYAYSDPSGKLHLTATGWGVLRHAGAA